MAFASYRLPCLCVGANDRMESGKRPKEWNPYHPAYAQDVTNMYMAGRVEAMFNPLGLQQELQLGWSVGLLPAGRNGDRVAGPLERDQLSPHSEAYDAGLHLGPASPMDQVFMEPRWSHNVYRIPYNNVRWSELFSDNTHTVNVGLTVMSRHLSSASAAATVKERPESDGWCGRRHEYVPQSEWL